MSSSLHISGSSLNNIVFPDESATIIGWVPGPDGRGTIDIIWGCLLTIFLCTWTAVCLNLPHPNDSKQQILLRRMKWMAWGILGPELLLSVAIGQFASARRSVRRFRRLGYSQWTLRHAFFADMGGIFLQPKDSTPFLVNSRQLAYLIERGYTDFPEISAADIWDKSKADTMTRVLALAQTAWLIVQLCGRASQGLPITSLELSTAAIVFCTFGTFLCWLQKPSDVQRGITISIPVTTTQILIDAGTAAAEPYKHTPLDFVAKQHFTCGYDVMRFFNMRCDDSERPLRRFPNDRFPDIRTFEKLALFSWTLSYAAVHLVGWNFEFPTQSELLLWRISSLIVTFTTLLWWTLETIAARQRFGRWDKYLIWFKFRRKSILPSHNTDKNDTSVERDDAFEQEQSISKPILWWEAGLSVPIVFAYVAARIYLIIEVGLSLRALPMGAFKVVQVSQMLPHW